MRRTVKPQKLPANCPLCKGTGKEPDYDSLGEAMRARREAKKIKFRWMAEQMGISDGMLSYLERGERKWTKRHIEAYEKVLRS